MHDFSVFHNANCRCTRDLSVSEPTVDVHMTFPCVTAPIVDVHMTFPCVTAPTVDVHMTFPCVIAPPVDVHVTFRCLTGRAEDLAGARESGGQRLHEQPHLLLHRQRYRMHWLPNDSFWCSNSSQNAYNSAVDGFVFRLPFLR